MFGGTGMQKERSAAGAGLCCPNWNLTISEGGLEGEGAFAAQFGLDNEEI